MRTIRIAIVNRGEAATRALNTIPELSDEQTNYVTIALYTDPDAGAQFVRRSDEAVHIGPAQYTDESDGSQRHSYLDHDRLFAALEDARADAVWVGWGFVAEDAQFAAGCEARGIVFIGPPPAAMRQLSDKIAAKRAAEAAGVPVAPWSGGLLADPASALAHAERIGFPVMIKAAAGGGGRGIRLVREASELSAAVTDAMSEARHAFGDSSVFLERCVPAGRHLEVQVLGDGAGTIWTLGVRECTAQRRRQKVLEESGLAIPDPELEETLKRHARALCGAVGYVNAGTVEFLYDPDTGEAYFMEVNTRLQVEHTVTEAVTGVDLVAWQIAIAFGARLPADPPAARGHAIEVRLNAEDAQRGFAPAPGKVVLFRPPSGPGIRVDSGIVEGDTVPPDFDSMIAKIIAWAPNRAAALRRMKRALTDTRLLIAGGASNRAFLLSLVRDPQVLAGTIHTAWLDQHTVAAGDATDHFEDALILAGIEAYERDLAAQLELRGKAIETHAAEIWQDDHRYELRCGKTAATLLVGKLGPGSYRLIAGDGTAKQVTVVRPDSYERQLMSSEKALTALVTGEVGGFVAEIAGTAYKIVEDDAGAVRTSFPAVIVAVRVKAGATVKAGDPLMVVESMKMESVISAPISGAVRELAGVIGTKVAAGAVVARIDEAEASPGASKLSFISDEAHREDALQILTAWLSGFDVSAGEARSAAREAAQSFGDLDPVFGAFAQVFDESGPNDGGYREALWRVSIARLRAAESVKLLQGLLARRGAKQATLERLAALYGPATDALCDLAASLLASSNHSTSDAEQAAAAVQLFETLGPAEAHDTKAVDRLAGLPVAWDRWLRAETVRKGRQSWFGTLLRRSMPPALRAPAALQLYIGSRYQPTDGPAVDIHDGIMLGQAKVCLGGSDAKLVVVTVPRGREGAALRVASKAAGAERTVVECLWTGDMGDASGRDRTGRMLGRILPDRAHQVILTKADSGGSSDCVVFERAGAAFVPRGVVGSVHPALLDRLEFWRLAQFECEVLTSLDHMIVVRATSRHSPVDRRLFVFADVLGDPADLGPSWHEHAVERALVEALERMRQTLTIDPDRYRLGPNRIVLTSRFPWRQPLEFLAEIGKRVVSRTRGLSLDPVTFRMPVIEPGCASSVDSLIQLALSSAGVQLGRKAPSTEAIRPLGDLKARMERARRQGFVHPHEIIRVMTSPDVLSSDFPTGTFTELDLDEDGERLRPVARGPGQQAANLVIGVMTNITAKHPEGMRRIAILGDPTNGLGSLGEAECSRIIAALELARAEKLPVEWFAVSSGARVAMGSGTENLDWTARTLREIVLFTQAGGVINVVVTGINVGAQSYWNAEATMLMHTRGTLIMVGESAMVLTGKQALDYSGSISAPSNAGIGGFHAIMGPNGQAQHWAASIEDACQLLFRHYELTYVTPGETGPRGRPSTDSETRNVCLSPHAGTVEGFETIGAIFSAETNPDRKQPFDIRSVMEAVADADSSHLERWASLLDGESAIVWDVHLGGYPVRMLGLESKEIKRGTLAPLDGPKRWTSGTLFPLSSKKIARAINGASGNRPVVVLANLSGFDGSPESMRSLQLEYGAEIARAVVNFQGRIVFCVISRYHGGAFVVFSKQLNPGLTSIALEGSHASVLGGAPAAAVVFGREVKQRVELQRQAEPSADPVDIEAQVRSEIAREYDAVHTIERAMQVGSIDTVISPQALRPALISQLQPAYTS